MSTTTISPTSSRSAPTLTSTPQKRGYHKLASFMASENESAIFRRFTRLNLLNLMSLQAELMELEEDLDIAWDHDEVKRQSKNFAKDFNALRKARKRAMASSNGESVREQSGQLEQLEPPEPLEQLESQWQIMLDIRKKLKEYNETLIQVAKVRTLDEPEKETIKILRGWLEHGDYGKGEFSDLEIKAWEPPDRNGAVDDLLSLQSSTDKKAPFATWVTGGLLTLFHNKLGSKAKLKFLSRPADPEAGPDIRIYSDTKLEKSTKFVVTVIASLLPVVCIVVLNTLKSVGLRLGITALFTAVFAAILVVFTSAREVEIFATTAAFAAVEVVFIGSTLSATGGNSTDT